MRICLYALGLVVLLASCTSHEIGRTMYRAMEQNKCLEEHGSHGVCARQSANSP
ncbi:MAG: hypothetical protein G8237_08865 [Magnetococcales bacterium]|nr:hypothetical protein [Magnetococcales bacterium]